MPPKDLQVLITHTHETVTVSLVGEAHIDFDTSDAHIQSIMKHAPKRVVVEMAQLSFITSIGMCFLINLRRHVRETGGSMRLHGLQPQVRKVMEHAHVIHMFDLPPEETRGTD
jgi:anti-anti-sigma factor